MPLHPKISHDFFISHYSIILDINEIFDRSYYWKLRDTFINIGESIRKSVYDNLKENFSDD